MAYLIEFAGLRVMLQRQGNLLANLELVITATALHFDHSLLTVNRRHFERIPDTRLYAFR